MITEFIDGFEVGSLAGLQIGYAEGRRDHDREVQAWLGVTRSALSLPTQDELAKARTVDNEPCGRRCKACSRCVRFAAAWRNQRVYGSPDYPGQVAS